MVDDDAPRGRGRPRVHPRPEEEERPPEPKGILCPRCGSVESYVARTLPATGGRKVRERVCKDCRKQWKTVEEPAE